MTGDRQLHNFSSWTHAFCVTVDEFVLFSVPMVELCIYFCVACCNLTETCVFSFNVRVVFAL